MWKVGDKLGRFRLDREIGQGSHGVVFVATDTALETPVAVKILHAWLAQDTAVRERFKRELLLARRVAHQGVCRLFDLHEEGESVFITMDYVEGETLLNILKNEGRILPHRGVRILRGICQALAAAHSAGVIHRDLKPANIIIRAGDNPMILDFGTATAADVSRVTRPGTAVGSMRFIAPEVFTGVAPSIRTDLYSLGVVAYVTLAGRLPYNAAAGALEMLEMIRTQPPQRLDAVQTDIPPSLADAVARAMEKDPEARFATALAFDEALAEIDRELVDGNTRPSAGNPFASWGSMDAGHVEAPPATAPALPPATLMPSPPVFSRARDEAPTDAAAPPSERAAVAVAVAGPETSPPADGKTVVARLQPAGFHPDPPAVVATDPPIVEPPAAESEQPPNSPFDESAGAGASEEEPNTDETRQQDLATFPGPGPDGDFAGGTMVGPGESPDSGFGASDVTRVGPLEALAPQPAPPKQAGKKVLIAAAAGSVLLAIAFAALRPSASGPDPFAVGAGPARSADAGLLAVLGDAGGETDAGAAADAGAAGTLSDAGGMVAQVGGGDEAVVAPDAGPEDVAAADGGTVEEEQEPREVEALDFGPVETRDRVKPRRKNGIDDEIRAVRNGLGKRGFIDGDYPAVDALLARARRQKDEKLVAEAKAAAESLSLDRPFVLKKLQRFNSRYDKTKRPDVADKVEPLAREALAAFGAGQLAQANSKLNSAFLLIGGKAK